MIGTKVREERYIGDREHLGNLMRRLADSGELVAMTEPEHVIHPVTGAPALLVIAQVRDPLPAKTGEPAKDSAASWKQQMRAWLVRHRVPVAITVAAMLALAAIGYALILLTQFVLSHLALIIGALFATLALWFLLGRAGVCPGLHCPGCRHNH